MRGVEFESQDVRMSGDWIAIRVPLALRPLIELDLGDLQRAGGPVHVRMGPSIRRISTGPRSQNNRIHGHAREIASQLRDPVSGRQFYHQDEIVEAMKIAAMEDGYPGRYVHHGGRKIHVPASLSGLAKHWADLVIKHEMLFADEHSLALTERDDQGRPYQTVGGVPVGGEQ